MREGLEELLIKVGTEPPNKEELSLLFTKVDRNGDGCIILEEFGAISSAFGPPACDSELLDAFEDCRQMINGVDKNRDGFICFEDFSRMMELQR
ncbi:OLC1v1028474C1 [Oldenlandia corymbosa var. corymbosa]|uniref:OLC1v1028474C1 n=1 Tax=Oldenlandia corymbosa var. corymbosa TaxID=529605 RepID=A0AAV1CCD4_OLDCO|nr:OLC1v1028474C1 [Oldenlandia corymbosa var. corymbosa]